MIVAHFRSRLFNLDDNHTTHPVSRPAHALVAPRNDLRSLGVALHALRIESASQPPLPVLPALVPLAWAALAAAFVVLAAQARLPHRAAWAIAIVVVAVLSLGLILQRPQTLEL